MTDSPEAEVVIGTLVGPFGVRGEVKVALQTDYPERFYDMDEAILRDQSGERTTFKIEGVRFHKGMALLKLEGCNDMTAAEDLRGRDVVVPESETVDLGEGEFFIHDLIGLQVFGTDGKDLGKITEVLRGVANDGYVTEKTIIPALKSVVREVDLAGRKMIVDLPFTVE